MTIVALGGCAGDPEPTRTEPSTGTTALGPTTTATETDTTTDSPTSERSPTTTGETISGRVVTLPTGGETPFVLEASESTVWLRTSPGDARIEVSDREATIRAAGVEHAASLSSSAAVAPIDPAGKGDDFDRLSLDREGQFQQDALPPFGNDTHKERFQEMVGDELDSVVETLKALGISAVIGSIVGAVVAYFTASIAIGAALGGLAAFAYFGVDLAGLAEDSQEGVCDAAVSFYCEAMDGGDIFEERMSDAEYQTGGRPTSGF